MSEANPAVQRNAHLGVFAALAAALVAGIVFAAARNFGFVYDDHRFYADNAYLLDRSILWRAFADPACQTSDLTHAGLWRPLRTLSFALDRWFGQSSPFAPHLTNVLLHALGTFLLARLLTLWRMAPLAAFFGAVAYALHPVQIECVAWISSRGDLLAAACLWGALLADGGGRRWPALLLGAMALLSKEQAIVWPALAVLSAVFSRATWGAALRRGVGPLVVTAAFLLIRHAVLTDPLQEGGLGSTPSLATLAAMFAHQAWFTLLPLGQLFDWQMPQPVGAAAIAMSVLVAVLAAGLIYWRPTRAGTLWFMAALVPTLFVQAFVPLNILVADRFLLFTLPVLALLVATATSRSVAIPATLCLCLGAITTQSLPTWRSDEALWSRTAARSASPWRAEGWLGVVALREDRLRDAIVHLRRATEFDGAFAMSYFHLALAQEQEGMRASDPDMVAAAIASLGEARRRFSLPRQEGALEFGLLAALMEADLMVMIGDARASTTVDKLVGEPLDSRLPALSVATVRQRAGRLEARLRAAGDDPRARKVAAWRATGL